MLFNYIIGDKSFTREFSEYQNALLIKSFLNNPKPSAEQIVSLATSLNLTLNQVKTWFYRIKRRVKKYGANSTITGTKT